MSLCGLCRLNFLFAGSHWPDFQRYCPTDAAFIFASRFASLSLEVDVSGILRSHRHFQEAPGTLNPRDQELFVSDMFGLSPSVLN